jgi:hypothetical protein
VLLGECGWFFAWLCVAKEYGICGWQVGSSQGLAGGGTVTAQALRLGEGLGRAAGFSAAQLEVADAVGVEDRPVVAESASPSRGGVKRVQPA